MYNIKLILSIIILQTTLFYCHCQPPVDEPIDDDPEIEPPNLGPQERTTKGKELATYNGFEMRKNRIVAGGTIQVNIFPCYPIYPPISPVRCGVAL